MSKEATKMHYDICGWATRNDVRCKDGRIIRHNAFKDCHGKIVPLIFQHNHSDVQAVLGNALLEHRPEGVYYYASFNNTPNGQQALKAVEHGDLRSISIYANELEENDDGEVFHGDIKELSVCLAAANPMSTLEHPTLGHSGLVIADKGLLRPGADQQEMFLQHGEVFMEANNVVASVEETMKEPAAEPETNTNAAEETAELSHADVTPEEETETTGRTVAEVYETMTDEQKAAVAMILGAATEDDNPDKIEHSNIQNGGSDSMKSNVFDTCGVVLGQDSNGNEANTLSHSAVEAIFADAKRGSGTTLSEAVLAHSDEYGIENIEWLFPDYKTLQNTPEWIKRPDGWVNKVLNSVHHSPFSRIKTIFADITADEARAKGYAKGAKKINEVFSLLKRETPPTTIYKKQKLDRDDIIDITDFDVVSWIKAEMRMMLDEEIARAILVGDGRDDTSPDWINTGCIRPIWTDTASNLYAVRDTIDNTAGSMSDDDIAKAFIKKVIKMRKDYRGSGNPTLYTTEDMLANLLLLEDLNGRFIYETEQKLATTLRVKEIVTVPVMEETDRFVDEEETTVAKPLGILVNLADYNVGADKGGAINMFDDFDIDYNQQKFLIETRCSGALVRPKSALVLDLLEAAPANDNETNG